MFPVSSSFNEAATQLSRSSQSKVVFGVYDVTAKSDASIASTSIQPFSNVNSTIDEAEIPAYNIATLEDELFTLDGSFYLMPDDVASTDLLSFWSQSMSDANKVFDSQIVLTYTFSGYHSSLGIELIFDDYTGDCIEDLTIKWYDGLTLLDTVQITGNASSRLNVENAIENYDKVVLELTKTSKPYRYAKISEINFGLATVFTSNDIVEGSVIEEFDPSGSKLSTNKLDVVILNEDQKFNIINPTGIFSYLQRNQALKVSVALATNSSSIHPTSYEWDTLGAFYSIDSGSVSPTAYEWVDLGVFYLSEWKNATGLTALLSAIDVTGLLDKTTYSASELWNEVTLETIVSNILQDAEAQNPGVRFPYEISDALTDVRLSGYVPITSHKDAIQQTLISARASLMVKRNGTILITKPSYVEPIYDITYDAILSPTPEIQQKSLVTTVKAKAYTYGIGPNEQIAKVEHTYSGTVEVVIQFDSPATSVIASISGLGSISSSTISLVSAKLTIVATGAFTITLSGNRLLESVSEISSSTTLEAGQTKVVAEVADNKLIVGNVNAKLVTDYLLEYYQRRIKQSFDYFTNPALQAGDLVDVETMFGVSKSGMIERNVINFAPSLRGEIEVVG